MLSIIIPTLNSAAGLKRALPPLLSGLHAGIVRELIIADSGSKDATIAIADAAGAAVVASALGEGAQSISGALVARAPWLMFLHADAALEPAWSEEVAPLLGESGEGAYVFRIGLRGAGFAARAREAGANAVLAMTKKPARTQGLLISRALYQKLGGYSAAPGAHRELIERIGGARLKVLRARAII